MNYNKASYKNFNNEKDVIKYININQEPFSNDKANTSLLYSSNDIIDYFVYTDGACSNNGKKNANAAIGIYFGINDKRNLSKKIIGKQTNNIAELSAIIDAYKIIETDLLLGKNICIVTDSEYSLKCITSYGEKNYKNNWQTNIKNKELVKEIFLLFYNKKNIKFLLVRAHTNKTDIHSIGNNNADKLAALGL